MNCVPGDRAIIIDDHPANPNTAGRLCDVLYLSPRGSHYLPDGTSAFSSLSNGAAWVIKLDSPADVMWRDGILRKAKFAVCPDSKLKPIRDQPGCDETLIYAGLPQPIEIDCITKQGEEA